MAARNALPMLLLQPNEISADWPVVGDAPLDQAPVQQEPVNQIRIPQGARRSRNQNKTVYTIPSSWFPERTTRKQQEQRLKKQRRECSRKRQEQQHSGKQVKKTREVPEPVLEEHRQYPEPLVPYMNLRDRLNRPREESSSLFVLTPHAAATYLDSPIPPNVDRTDMLMRFHDHLLRIRKNKSKILRAELFECIAIKVLHRSIPSFYMQLKSGWYDWANEYTVGRRIWNWMAMDPSWRREFLELPRVPFYEKL